MRKLITQLNELRKHPEPDTSIYEACASIAREANEVASQHGIQPVKIPTMLTPLQAIAIVNKVAMAIEPDRFLMVPDAAKVLSVSQAKVAAWIKQGRLQAVNVASDGKRPQYRIAREALTMLAPVVRYKAKHL